VPCARYFSYEANIYVRGFLDMRVLLFSYPHPFLPPSLPWFALSELKTTTVWDFVRETSLGNSVWSSFLNSVSSSGGEPCHSGPPTWRPRGNRKFVFACVFLRGVLPAWDVGATSDFIRGFLFWFSLALQVIIFLCLTLYDFVSSCVFLNHSLHYTLL
jgi:hypothetical protein